MSEAVGLGVYRAGRKQGEIKVDLEHPAECQDAQQKLCLIGP
ncbi:MAG: hypothetical protein ACR2Q3_03100 [Woeseiaceae bacterium]